MFPGRPKGKHAAHCGLRNAYSAKEKEITALAYSTLHTTVLGTSSTTFNTKTTIKSQGDIKQFLSLRTTRFSFVLIKRE